MTHTPAVGVAGHCGGRSAQTLRRVPWGGLIGFRPALLLLAFLVAAAGSLVAAVRPVAAITDSLDLRATYDVQASINWQQNWLSVSSVARVRNATGAAVDRVTFNLVPLRTGRAVIHTVSVAKETAQFEAADQSIVVTLPSPLAPEGEVNVRIEYSAFFDVSPTGKEVLFMKKDEVATAYRWIPWISREQQFATKNFGETWVTGVSSRVDVMIRSDIPLVFATSGRRTGGDVLTQTFTATDVRDFNFSVSPSYSVSQRSWNGIEVNIFHRTISADRYWKWTLMALEHFANQVGAYPYSQLNVAETYAGTGMESPGLIWIDATYPKSAFPHIVVHETAHQWFYGIVGNNQAADPFLDEGLSEYLTRDLLGSFRKSRCANKPLDKTVYEYGRRCYSEIIYVQSALYLRDYRTEVGNEAFWGGMQTFFAQRAFGLAGTRSFWETMDAVSGYDSSRHHARFPTLF